jgi:hypothetical protein
MDGLKRESADSVRNALCFFYDMEPKMLEAPRYEGRKTQDGGSRTYRGTIPKHRQECQCH